MARANCFQFGLISKRAMGSLIVFRSACPFRAEGAKPMDIISSGDIKDLYEVFEYIESLMAVPDTWSSAECAMLDLTPWSFLKRFSWRNARFKVRSRYLLVNENLLFDGAKPLDIISSGKIEDLYQISCASVWTKRHNSIKYLSIRCAAFRTWSYLLSCAKSSVSPNPK